MSPCRWCVMVFDLAGSPLPELPGPPGKHHRPLVIDPIEAARQAERRARKGQEAAKRPRQGPEVSPGPKKRLRA